MATYGKHRYSVAESNNLQLGQNGFDVFSNGATPSNETGTWVALQALGVSANALVLVHAEVAAGENLSDNAGTGEVTLQGGGAPVYGCFNKLVSATIAAGSVLIAYRG
jgi:hypothetical protein